MKVIVNTTNAPAPIGPYSQAVWAGNILFVSGQIAIDPETNEVLTGDVANETRQVMKNLAAILKEAGLSFDNVVKTGIFLKSMADFAVVNEIYGSYLSGNYPARETVEVAGLPKNVSVEISVVAVKF
ncbi:RidA family protein [Solitalea canadensis]|uniref:Endoribonuclease L-PSP, putative n=1 Tax=Solitalea canadensis (strain ATCC 29591 / DSM 3403 / JCM 21819 / LMG 8368 / NBRC 15130 / NCIMB 12057 / USAM 9D) TaxID=929556 RepID=H8KXE9_SOLCM|nr:RidA family protein [Solitalea canadensis]AFD08478.1 endoribonuclease L-PSP, putative [Solitalea canadensis DSM 3403]